jgi:hypothetical protein
MKTKSLGIILILTVLLLAWGSAYSRTGSRGGTFKAHPWEEGNNSNGPYGCSAKILKDDPKVVIMIPIFSDFVIWIYIWNTPNDSEHQKNSVEMGDNSYQIIFPW